jgi:uncharacterized RDD family membrane protein YckC
MAEKENFKFKPLSEGLGFHPFSDGLPYSPKTKTPLRAGTGAVSAGNPHFAFPKTKAPIRPNLNLQTDSPRPVSSAPTRTNSALARTELAIEAPVGARWARTLAYVIDMTIHFAITIGFLVLAQAGSPSLSIRNFLFGDFAVLLILAFLVLNYALVTAQELIFRTTLGKSFFRLGLSGSTMTILTRALLFIPSIGFGGIGILWALFDRDRMCWHDRATGIAPRKYT